MEFRETNVKYKNRCRSRVSNLKDNKNPILRQRVMSREIDPDVFAKMNAEVSSVLRAGPLPLLIPLRPWLILQGVRESLFLITM